MQPGRMTLEVEKATRAGHMENRTGPDRTGLDWIGPGREI